MTKLSRQLVACVGILGLAVGSGVGFAQEKAAAEKPAAAAPAKVELPKVCADAVKAAFPDMTIGTVTERDMRGNKMFMVALTKGDVKKEATVTEAGVVTSVATPIKVDELPKAVAEAVAKEAQGATIERASKVEMLTGRDGTKLDTPRIAYSVDLAKDGKVATARVPEDGSSVRIRNWTDKPAAAPTATK